jgi:DeoR/GlpR family transcriptional regulator of sugar metabolism
VPLLPSGAATVADLADGLGVSEMTIRRDLGVLAGQQLVEKVHGGAVLARRGAAEPHFATKRRINAAAKAAIAEAAVAMVADGMTVALSAGTTTWQVAQRLRGGPVRDLTFVTNSLNVAGRLEANGWHRIVVSGRLVPDAVRRPGRHLRQPDPAPAQRRPAGAGRALDRRQGRAHHPQHRRGRDQPGDGRRGPAGGGGGRLEQARQVSLATFAGCDDVDELVTDSGADPATLAAVADAGLRTRVVEPLRAPAEGAAS